MTERQHKAFYLKNWTACARANGWHTQAAIWAGATEETKRDAENPFIAPVLAKLRACAHELSEREHRGERPNDYRHACHIVALGKNKSSLDLTNDECERVVTLFRVLTDPDNLDYVAHWLDPELAKKANLIAAAKLKAPEAYVTAIMADKFHTGDIDALSVKQLQSLCFTLNQRKATWAKPVGRAESEPEEVF